ncbi:MAG: hypothetical protein LC800_01710 [Acidobacteria bacterium]|nr:hypothetical protein [Acidobacteriota bacterium]
MKASTSNKTVAAEIVPAAGQAHSAAKALQQLGFRVLHIGSTVSVQAPERVWKDTFNVSFTKKRQQRLAISPKSSTEYAVPVDDRVEIPSALGELVAEVIFVRPPEFF